MPETIKMEVPFERVKGFVWCDVHEIVHSAEAKHELQDEKACRADDWWSLYKRDGVGPEGARR